MPYTYTDYTGDGSTVNFSYSAIAAGLLPTDAVPLANQIKVYKAGVLQTITTHYTINTSLQRVQFVAAPLVGEAVRVAREFDPANRYVDYTNGGNLYAGLLDLDAQHLFGLIQQIYDKSFSGYLGKGTDLQWDATNLRIENVANATTNDAAVNKGQMDTAIAAAAGGAQTRAYSVTTGTNATSITVSAIPFCVGTIVVEIDGAYQSGTICVANTTTKNNSTSTRRSGVVAVTSSEQVFFEADRTAFTTTCDVTIRMRRIGYSSFTGNDIAIGSINSNPEFPNSTAVRVFCIEDKSP